MCWQTCALSLMPSHCHPSTCASVSEQILASSFCPGALLFIANSKTISVIVHGDSCRQWSSLSHTSRKLKVVRLECICLVCTLEGSGRGFAWIRTEVYKYWTIFSILWLICVKEVVLCSFLMPKWHLSDTYFTQLQHTNFCLFYTSKLSFYRNKPIHIYFHIYIQPVSFA